MKFGRFEILTLNDGRFALDGGAMYGVVPKSMWSRHEHADDQNRIQLNLGCFLIKTPKGHNILVDTGLSSKYENNKKFKKMFCVDRPKTLRDDLKSHGISPEDIHVVINTHLHFDHAGGNTEWGDDGKPVLAYPKAKYLIQKEEWEDGTHPHERNAASYLKENFEPLEDLKALDLVEGDYEIEPGLKVSRSGGHTRGHQCVTVESEGETALFMGDLVPTRAHVPLPFIMGFDLYPVDTLECKRKFLGEAAEKGWTLFFQHDIGQRHAKIVNHEGRFVAKVDPS